MTGSDKRYYGDHPIRVSEIHTAGIEYWTHLDDPSCFVSSFGRVRSGSSGHLLTQYKAGRRKDPYLYVLIHHKGRKRIFCVHRLVAKAFLEEKPPGHEVHHRDHDRFNNRASNLEYVTSAENKLAAVANGYCGERRYNAVFTEEKVARARSMHRDGWMIKEIARELGVSYSATKHVVAGRTWKHVT